MHTTGVLYSILKQLVWKNIHVAEMVPTLTEFTIVLQKDQVDISFSFLM